jgi:lipopolysaccharide export system protein LptA
MTIPRSLSFATAALAVLISGAMAAEPTGGAKQSGGLNMGKHDTSAPINVSSDNFVGDMQTKVGTYIGNVIVVQADFKLRADKVSIHEVANKPSTIDGAGHVLFVSPNGSASGDTGVYDLNAHTITMDGKVVLTKEKDVMRGTHVVMNMDTGLANLTAKGMPGGRVQALFIPPPKGQSGTKSQSQTTGKSPGK